MTKKTTPLSLMQKVSRMREDRFKLQQELTEKRKKLYNMSLQIEELLNELGTMV